MLTVHIVFLRFRLFVFFLLWKEFTVVYLRKRHYKRWNFILHTTDLLLGLCCLFPTIPETLCRRMQQVRAGCQQQNLTLVWVDKLIRATLDHTLMGECSPGQHFLHNSGKQCMDRLKNRVSLCIAACYIQIHSSCRESQGAIIATFRHRRK